MPISDAALFLAGLGLGIAGGATLMRARQHVVPEFRDRVAGTLWLPHADWYTPEGKRLRHRGFFLQAAAILVWLIAAAT